MIVSYSHRFLFVRVPKTASSSISEALGPYRNPLERSIVGRIWRQVNVLPQHHKFVSFAEHPHWSILKDKAELPEHVFDSLFRFAFVRHPVSWHLSTYKHIMRRRNEEFFARHYAPVVKGMTFEDYVRWRIDLGPIPQITQLLDRNGHIRVHRIGRFESLQVDFEDICRKLTLSCTLPHVNRTPSTQEVIPSRAAVQLIADTYRVDFEAFGYGEDGIESEISPSIGSLSFSEVLPMLITTGFDRYDPWKTYPPDSLHLITNAQDRLKHSDV